MIRLRSMSSTFGLNRAAAYLVVRFAEAGAPPGERRRHGKIKARDVRVGREAVSQGFAHLFRDVR